MKIQKIEHLKNLELRFIFENGHIRDIDFEPFLRLHIDHPAMNPYLEIKEFKKFKNDKFCVSWKNDMDFSAESLYNDNWSETQIQKNQKEISNSSVALFCSAKHRSKG